MSTPFLPAPSRLPASPWQLINQKPIENAAQTAEISTWIEASPANSLTAAIIHALIHSFIHSLDWLIQWSKQRKLSPAGLCKQIVRLNEMNIHLSDCLLCNACADNLSLCVIRVMCSAAKELRKYGMGHATRAEEACNECSINYLQRKSIWVQHECNKQAQLVTLTQTHTCTYTYECVTSVNMSHTHAHSLTACTVCVCLVCSL